MIGRGKEKSMFWDYVIIVFAVGVVASVVISSIIAKKKGKSGCGCDCSSCSACSACRKTEEDKNAQ